MWNEMHGAYLESRILAADPIELVRLLYQTGIRAVQDARRHLERGSILERSHAITNACQVVIHLAASLDHERGGEISRRLAALYDYILRRLTEANFQQRDEPLAEVLRLLVTLAEGWEGVKPAPQPQARAGSPWKPEAAGEPTLPCAEHAWSF